MSLFQPNRRQGDPQSIVEEAILDFTLGDNPTALAKLNDALALDPACFAAWHALAEVQFAARNLDAALAAGLQAHALRPADIHVNTSLSRIYMEKGDKPTAEHYGAQARMLSWKDELKQPPPPSNPPSN
jgi:tetratricopeptide (TPR) repeat protein